MSCLYGRTGVKVIFGFEVAALGRLSHPPNLFARAGSPLGQLAGQVATIDKNH
jgi:hypothetical protein